MSSPSQTPELIETQLEKPPNCETQIEKSLISETQMEKPPISETQIEKSTSSETQMGKSSDSGTQIAKSSDSVTQESQTLAEPSTEKDPETLEEREGEEEEGECGFCLYMKGGGCKEIFVAWEKCIADAEEKKNSIVEKCYEVTGALKKCMEVHSEYYAPILQAEKAAEAEAVKELEKEKEREKGEREEVHKD